MITIEISTSNAAFDGDNKADEIARILHDLADRFDEGDTDLTILDINGNKVGQYTDTDNGTAEQEGNRE